MKRKFLSVLIALVLVMSFSSVTALPAAAEPDTLNVIPFRLVVSGDGTAQWSTTSALLGNYSVELVGGATQDGDDYAAVVIPMDGTMLLSEVITFVYNYTFASAGNWGPHMCFYTHDPVDDETGEISLYSGSTGPPAGTPAAEGLNTVTLVPTTPGFFWYGTETTSDLTQALPNMYTLAQFQADDGTGDDGDGFGRHVIDRVQIEYGWWSSGDASEPAYVDDVTLNTTTYDLEGTATDYTTIQAAIDAAFEDDIISVADGAYVEDVSVSTANLTLMSENGMDSTIIGGKVTITAAADDFVLGGSEGHGFTLQESAVLVNVDNPTDAEISWNKLDTGEGTPSRAVHFSGAGATGLTVTQNDFLVTDQYDQGVRNDFASAALVGLTVTNNTFTGVDNTLETSAIEINHLDISTVDSVFSGNEMYTVGNGVLIGSDSGGGLVCGTGDTAGTLEISGNTFDECNYGIDLVNATATGVDQNVVVRWNTFTDGNYGFTVDFGTYPSATDNWEPGDFTVEYNNFSGNTYGIYNNVTEAVTAENNWWGNTSGPLWASALYDIAYGDDVSDGVDYQPWLLAEAEVDVTPTTYERTLALKDVWTLVSVDEEVTTGTTWVDTTLEYMYTPSGGYTQVDLATQLTSVDAYYLKTDGGGGVGINYSTTGAPGVVTKDLEAGWNIISCAGQPDAYTLLSQLRYALIGQEEGVGLTSLVGQGGYNQFTDDISVTLVTSTEWDAIKGGNGGTVTLNKFDGFWVYMNADKSFGVIP